jgi:hypothetical protein
VGDPDYGWRYHFVPLPTIVQSDHRIFRVALSHVPELASTEVVDTNEQVFRHALPGKGTLYRSPYSSFPILRSHVHPFFVICKAYYAFRSHFRESDPPNHLRDHWELLRCIYEKYWVPPPNQGQKASETSFDDNGDHLDRDTPSCPSEDGSLDDPDGDDAAREPPVPEDDERRGADDDLGPQDRDSLRYSDDLPEFDRPSFQDSTSEPEMEDIFTINLPSWIVGIYTENADTLESEWSKDVKEIEVKLTQEQLHEDVIRQMHDIFRTVT